MILSDCFAAIDKTEKNMHFEILVISRGSYFEFRIRREVAPDVNCCSFCQSWLYELHETCYSIKSEKLLLFLRSELITRESVEASL